MHNCTSAFFSDGITEGCSTYCPGGTQWDGPLCTMALSLFLNTLCVGFLLSVSVSPLP